MFFASQKMVFFQRVQFLNLQKIEFTQKKKTHLKKITAITTTTIITTISTTKNKINSINVQENKQKKNEHV
jgi:hypothetical protein